MDLILQDKLRRSALGKLGELLAAEALTSNGFREVRNLNKKTPNQPFADLRAEKDGLTYFIGVKTRNENRECGRLNESYNCFVVAKPKNRRLKSEGWTTAQITQLALDQIELLAGAHEAEAVPAWITLPVRPVEGTYAAYFGTLRELGCKRCIPMTLPARGGYTCLIAEWAADSRVTRNLGNRRE